MSRLRLTRPRLLPALLGAMGVLLALKLAALALDAARGGAGPAAAPRVELVAAARAVGAPPPPPAPGPAPAPAPGAAPPAAGGAGAAPAAPACDAAPATPQQLAERAVLEGLRARRAELERREGAAAAREVVLAAAERRVGERVEELAALQRRLEAADRARGEREEAGWRQMVKLYEGMRPRDAAAIFDELEQPVLIEILARMGERRAGPVLAAMRPERARQATSDLARHRAARLPD